MKRFVMRGILTVSGILIYAGICSLKAQDIVVGAEYGISKVNLYTTMDNEKVAEFLTNRVGISLEFSPYFSKFYIASGASISMNELGNNINIPLTFRLALGKKVRPFAELGGYYSLNLNDADDQYLPQNDIGVKSMIGTMYHFDKRWRAELAYTMHFGLKEAYHEEIPMFLNQVSIMPYHIREGGVTLRLKYRF